MTQCFWPSRTLLARRVQGFLSSFRSPCSDVFAVSTPLVASHDLAWASKDGVIKMLPGVISIINYRWASVELPVFVVMHQDP